MRLLAPLESPRDVGYSVSNEAEIVHASPSVSKPRMDIMCRTIHGALFEIMRMMFTYLIFFPRYELSTQMILVFDAESENDHLAGSLLETAYQSLGVKVFFEDPPPPGTLTARVRSEGYSRSQWSNFYSDLYSDADFIGMIDSDTEFSFRPSIYKHVVLDWKQPVIYGIWISSTNLQSVKFMLGVDAVAEFMYVFPFVVKREHFALMRNHVIKSTGYATFEQAWFEMQNRYDNWGQFLLMGNYLYHFHHDEYVWDVVNKPISTTVSPCPHIGKNLPMNQDVEQSIRRYHHQICVQSKNIASECGRMSEMDVEIAKFVPFTDYWPIAGGVGGYEWPACKTHDSTAPRRHQEIFDSVVDEIFASGGAEFWQNSRYNRSERTRSPPDILLV